MTVSYKRGLQELGEGIYAYLQPDGGWGWSNAGLVAGEESSLLIDTLFDLRLTRDMLVAMRPVIAGAPIAQAVNTHGNGDHWFGNELLPDGIPIVATSKAAAEMRATPPTLVSSLFAADDRGPDWEAFANRTIRRFQLEGIEPRFPTTVFDGRLPLSVDDRLIEVIEVGPAHTDGDAIVWVPDSKAAFTGDILFIKGTPLVWAGPVGGWLLACDKLLALGAEVFIPGHGPVTDPEGVRAVQHYLRYVYLQARERFDAGLNWEEAADDIDLSDFDGWGDPERIVVNVATCYHEFDPTLPQPTVPELFLRMAEWSARH